jgi:renalase
MTKPRIAIIGAGISGIILARELQEIAEVKIFEKSRGVGGRMSTRYAEQFSFDHGAQCFTARNKSFQRFLQPFIASNDVAPWIGKAVNIDNDGTITPRFWFETHLVASPNMNSLCKKLAVGLDISCGVEVMPLHEKQDNQWHLTDKNGADLGVYDFVISTAPPAQTKNLFGSKFTADEIAMQPCYALMLGFNQKWNHDWIFAKVRNNPIKLIAVNSSKPARNSDVTSLVIHTRDNWTKENLERDQKEVEEILCQNFTQLTKINHQDAAYKSLHRWRYALIDETKNESFFDAQNKLAATSDWSTNSRIEDVLLAAQKLSLEVKEFIK